SYRFDSGVGALPLEGVSGDGDSGGPVLIEVDGTWRLAGLTSWKFLEGEFDLASFRPGRYGQVSKNVRISHYAEWIDAVISADQQVVAADAGTIDPTAIDRTL